MEMLEVELQLAQDSSTVDYYKNQMLPLVAMDYTYNMNGIGTMRGDAYDMMFDRTSESYTVGMNLIVPLGNEAAKNRLLEMQYRKRQRLFTKENRRIQIETEVLGASRSWRRTGKVSWRAGKIRFWPADYMRRRKGSLWLGFVLPPMCLTRRQNSRMPRAPRFALTEYQIAQVDLAYATGTLLGATKVSWEPGVP